MLKVGLTGSIGVGKSFVTSVLNELGCHTLDADVTAREVVLPGTPGLAKIVEAFGTEVLAADGTLNRKRLGGMVFADQKKRELLNAILHPIIMEQQDRAMRDWESRDPNGIGVIDAALTIESGGYRRFDKLIVVHCLPEIQIERLMARDGISQEQAEERVAAQMSQEDKLKFADYEIDTSEGFAETRRRTEDVYKQLRAVADAKNVA